MHASRAPRDVLPTASRIFLHRDRFAVSENDSAGSASIRALRGCEWFAVERNVKVPSATIRFESERSRNPINDHETIRSTTKRRALMPSAISRRRD